MARMISAEEAKVELHNWKMMHPIHTAEELREVMGEIADRIRR